MRNNDPGMARMRRLNGCLFCGPRVLSSSIKDQALCCDPVCTGMSTYMQAIAEVDRMRCIRSITPSEALSVDSSSTRTIHQLLDFEKRLAALLLYSDCLWWHPGPVT